jgi:hypothetical protein
MSLIDQTLGAELAGVFGSTLLFGVSIVQSYNFFASHAQNPLRLQLLVGISLYVRISPIGHRDVADGVRKHVRNAPYGASLGICL